MRRGWTQVLLVSPLVMACSPQGPGTRPPPGVDLRVLPVEAPSAETCPVVLALGMALLATPMLPDREGAVTLSLEASCEGENGPGLWAEVRLVLSVANEPDVRVEGTAEGPAPPQEAPEWDQAIALARVVAEALDDALAQYEVLHLSGSEVAERLNQAQAPPRAVLMALLERAERASLKDIVRLALGPDEAVAFRAVGALSRIGGHEGAAALGRVAVEGGPDVAVAAVTALGELPLDEAERALELVAGQSARAVVRLRALWYLGRGPERPGD